MITHDNLKLAPQSAYSIVPRHAMGTEQSFPNTSPSPPTPWICRRPVRLTIYGLLAAFVLWMLGWGILPRVLDPSFEQHIHDKSVMAGMSREQVMDAWGSPYQMNVSYTEKGIRREEWVYEDWLDTSTIKHGICTLKKGNC